MPAAFTPAIKVPDPGPGTAQQVAWGKMASRLTNQGRRVAFGSVGRMRIIEMAYKKRPGVNLAFKLRLGESFLNRVKSITTKVLVYRQVQSESWTQPSK